MKHKLIFNLIVILAFAATVRAHSSDDEKTATTKSFTVTKGGTLEVSTNNGEIRITTWTKNEVSVKVRGIEEDDDRDRLRITQSENTVRVETWESDEEVRFDISIPTQFNVDLRTSVGTIEIKGELIGRLEGTTSAGDIRLGNVGGEVDMRTSGGDIRTGKMDGTATLKTSGGNITVESSTGELDIRTSGGEITVGDVGKSLRASTSGGNVDVGNIGGDADLSTSGGNVNAGKITGKATLKTAGGDIELGGARGSVIAKTSGGNVVLEEIFGSVEARTAGGDVSVEMTPGGTGTSKLTSSGGNIKLTLPENAKATIDALIKVRGSGWGGHWSSMNDYSIHSDFKADSYEKDKEEKEIRGRYTINGGGQAISLQTVDGDIEILKEK